MNDTKAGEIQTDGKSVTIGAPVVRAVAGNQPSPSQHLGTLLRHLRGVTASLEELKKILEERGQ